MYSFSGVFKIGKTRASKVTAPPNTAPCRSALLKKINCIVYHSRGYTASCAPMRRAVTRREMAFHDSQKSHVS